MSTFMKLSTIVCNVIILFFPEFYKVIIKRLSKYFDLLLLTRRASFKSSTTFISEILTKVRRQTEAALCQETAQHAHGHAGPGPEEAALQPGHLQHAHGGEATQLSLSCKLFVICQPSVLCCPVLTQPSK